MEFLKDLAHGIRFFRNRPITAVVAVMTLGAALSLAGMGFELLVSLVSPEVSSSDTFGRIGISSPLGLRGVGPLPAHLTDEIEQTTSFAHAVGVIDSNEDLWAGAVENKHTRVEIARVGPGFFAAVGAAAHRGRVLRADDHLPNAPRVIVISHAIWRRVFGAGPEAVGRDVMVAGRSYQVVGVMPRGYSFPMADVWIPASASAFRAEAQQAANVYVRLRPGLSWSAAAAEIAALGTRLARQYPDVFRLQRLRLVSAREEAVARLGTGSVLLLGSPLLLLVVACLVVGNLLVSAAIEREREIGVRIALGASRVRLVRQLLTECLVLAAPAAALALALLYVDVALTRAVAPPQVQWVTDGMTVRPASIAFVLLVASITPLLFGAAPSVFALRTAPVASLQYSIQTVRVGLGHYTVRDLLVMLQVAGTVLIVAALAIVRSAVWASLEYEFGFDPEGLYAVRVVDERDFSIDSADRLYIDREAMAERLRGLVGVLGASGLNALPGTDRRIASVNETKTSRSQTLEARWLGADAPYFATLGVKCRAGRTMTADEIRGRRPVAVVTTSLARALWPSGGAVGRSIDLTGDDALVAMSFDVIGVVDDLEYGPFRTESRRAVFVPVSLARTASDRRGVWLLVRTTNGVARLGQDVRAVVGTVNPRWAVEPPRLYRDTVALPRTEQGLTFVLRALAVVALLTLVLAVIGVAAVTAEAVRANKRELGIRAACGASPGALVSHVMRQGLTKILVGVLLGLPGPVLYNYLNPPSDLADNPVVLIANAWTWVIVMASVGAIAAACYALARGASRSDPAILIRVE